MSKHTTRSDLVVRRATIADLEKFGDLHHKPSMKAWCGDINGRIIGIGGFYFHNGRWVGFCDLTDEARAYKVAFMKTAKMAVEDMRASGHKFIYAEIDKSFPMAPRWIESLGFERQPSGLWRWQQ